MPFILRNDDVACDTTIEELEALEAACEGLPVVVVHAVTPIGACQSVGVHMDNVQILQAAGGQTIFGNVSVVARLKAQRYQGRCSFGIHGLYHSHEPSTSEIIAAKILMERALLSPEYFVPPFNEGVYSANVLNTVVGVTLLQKIPSLEQTLLGNVGEKTVADSGAGYLHSWRFKNGMFSFKELRKCLTRICQI